MTTQEIATQDGEQTFYYQEETCKHRRREPRN